MSDDACQTFENLKDELKRATLNSIDDALHFVVECDASELAISATH